MQMSYANNLLNVTERVMEDKESNSQPICWVYILHYVLTPFAGDGKRKIAVSNTLCGSRCNVQNCEQADTVPFITQIKDGRQFIC